MLDKKDKAILDILSVSGRESASSISEKIGMSTPAVIDRINKLQDADIIQGYTAKINYSKLGMDISALITLISESSEHYYEVIELAKSMHEVVKCFANLNDKYFLIWSSTIVTNTINKKSESKDSLLVISINFFIK